MPGAVRAPRGAAVAAAVTARTAELPLRKGQPCCQSVLVGVALLPPRSCGIPPPFPMSLPEALLRAWLDAHHASPTLVAGLLSPELFQRVRTSPESWSVACGVPSTCFSAGVVGPCVGPALRAGPAGFGTPALAFFSGIRKSLVLLHFAFSSLP